jgi:WhiB family transcriptional regulator, redox-sensing transcriptional regulator
MRFRARPAWMDFALCRGMDPDLWFPTKGDVATGEAAKAICAQCPARMPCMEFAVATRETFGIWGGTSERQRQRIRKQRREQRQREAS